MGLYPITLYFHAAEPPPLLMGDARVEHDHLPAVEGMRQQYLLLCNRCMADYQPQGAVLLQQLRKLQAPVPGPGSQHRSRR